MRDGNLGTLGAASRFEAVELALEITAFDASRRPCGADWMMRKWLLPLRTLTFHRLPARPGN